MNSDPKSVIVITTKTIIKLKFISSSFAQDNHLCVFLKSIMNTVDNLSALKTYGVH